MPPLAAAIGGAATLIGGTGFGAVLTNALIGTALNFAIGGIVQAISGQEQQAQAAQVETVTGVELQFRSGVNVPVSAIAGIKDTPGHFAYHNSYGADNEYLQLLFLDGNGEHTEMIGILVDNVASTLSGSNADAKGRVINAFVENGTPYGWVKYFTGAAGQVADAELVARARPAERWTVDCKLTATAGAIITLRYNRDLFAGGIPNFRRIWKGLKFYDRRKDSTQPGGDGLQRWGVPSTYAWSENPAVIQDNWRRGIWANDVRLLGLGVSEYDCYHAGIVAAANVCDEAVTYADTGATLPRYVGGVEFKDGADPITMMRLFEAMMGGHGTEVGGAYTPLPAQTMVPVLTLTDMDRVLGEDVVEKTRMPPTETKTAFHGMFLSPADGWLPMEYGLRGDSAVDLVEGGQRLGPFDATFVRHREIAATLAEIKRRRDRFSAVETATYGPECQDLRPGQVVSRQSEVLGNIQMMVEAIRPLPRKCFRLSLRSWHNSIVPNPTGGFLPIPASPITAPAPNLLTHPLALLAVAASQISGDIEVPAIRVTFTPIIDRTVVRVVIKYWPAADPTAVRYQASDDPSTGVIVVEGVAPSTAYKVTGTVVTEPARATTWVEPPRDVTTSALIVPPAPGSVDASRLAPEVVNRITHILDGVIARQDDIELQLGDMADVVMTNATLSKTAVRGVSVRNAGALARIVEVMNVVVEAQAAIATLTTTVEAHWQQSTAGGLIGWQVQAGGGGGSARFLLAAKVNVNDLVEQAAFQVLAESDGASSSSEVLIMADAFKFLNTGGAVVSQSFAIGTDGGGDYVKVTNLRFENLSSIDLSTILMDGATGDFSFG